MAVEIQGAGRIGWAPQTLSPILTDLRSHVHLCHVHPLEAGEPDPTCLWTAAFPSPPLPSPEVLAL